MNIEQVTITVVMDKGGQKMASFIFGWKGEQQA